MFVQIHTENVADTLVKLPNLVRVKVVEEQNARIFDFKGYLYLANSAFRIRNRFSL